MALQIGDLAPSFTLYSSEKQEVSLSDYKGKKVVVLFFPLAFTGVCTEELCSVRDNIATYQNLNTEVLAISVDSLFSLEQFKKQQNLSFPLLSDFNKEVSAAYGALYDEFVLGMKGVSKRSAFVIDEEGKILYAEILEDAGQVPSFENIQKALQA
ncbi:redoxin domain-containing protein [Leadbetterella byssophila]|uniref:Alkyl hydroperoxide reductase/ Thiol specific antioxidant/ Mal allergen n=1 Tax=Leadbetterella byssophila (strain DSM 17132 / JCM 16389 / KACC 11308 / NBRC 106382 / 4M15) TaxID=649349 RepID=E4RSH9_LEAB4|nr:redoxin domain-containing protein [Leadbetterella byssophila]ADQ18549.1 alkyl hydroperoxide reductase/ Thiol specific antioxidant/ Mal allergen [Leadbetterella byssophila DSM 17132]